MGEGLNKPLFSQRCLQTFFIFLSHALLGSSSMFSKRLKRKIKQCLCTGYIFSIDLWPKCFCDKKKKAQFVIFGTEREFTNLYIEKSMSKVEV